MDTGGLCDATGSAEGQEFKTGACFPVCFHSCEERDCNSWQSTRRSQLNGEEEIIDYAEDYFEDSITIKNSEFALNASGAYGSISYYHIKCYADGYQAEI